MKKILLSLLFGLTATVATHAQYTYDVPPFGQGKIFVGASMSGFDIGSTNKTFHVDLSAKGGYMVMDNILAYGEVGYNYVEDLTAYSPLVQVPVITLSRTACSSEQVFVCPI